MSNKNIKSKKGFTIIEVVLVLAIAGLIFLMVCIALPQLQRAQRDTQRRNDMARLATAITQFQTNNGGKIPNEIASAQSDFVTKYLKDEFTDPDGEDYIISWGDAVTGTIPTDPALHTVYVFNKAMCEGETMVQSTNKNTRDYAILYKLEGSGTYCQDNNQ